MSKFYEFNPDNVESIQLALKQYLDDSSSFINAVDWLDSLVLSLLFFNFVVLATVISVRNSQNVLLLSTILGLISTLVLASATINEHASKYFKDSTHSSYFDKNGIFISIFWSAPLLFNLLILIIFLIRTNIRQMKILATLKKKSESKSKSSIKSKSTLKRSASRNRGKSEPSTPSKIQEIPSTPIKSKSSSKTRRSAHKRDAVKAVDKTPVPDTPRSSRAAKSRSFQVAMSRRAERDE